MRISDWSSDVCSSDLDLGRRGRDVRTYVHALENWVIAALSRIGIAAYPVPDRIGIWTRDGGEEAKIGAIGVRVRKWVTLHGFSVNITPDMAHFGGIVPCGLDRKSTRLNSSH